MRLSGLSAARPFSSACVDDHGTLSLESRAIPSSAPVSLSHAETVRLVSGRKATRGAMNFRPIGRCAVPRAGHFGSAGRPEMRCPPAGWTRHDDADGGMDCERLDFDLCSPSTLLLVWSKGELSSASQEDRTKSSATRRGAASRRDGQSTAGGTSRGSGSCDGHTG